MTIRIRSVQKVAAVAWGLLLAFAVSCGAAGGDPDLGGGGERDIQSVDGAGAGALDAAGPDGAVDTPSFEPDDGAPPAPTDVIDDLSGPETAEDAGTGAETGDAGSAEDGGEADAADTDAGPCPGGPDDPRCDDGDSCTRDVCSEEDGGCIHWPVSEGSCDSSSPCGVGRCVEGRCVDFDACDDVSVCTEDLCEADGTCSYEFILPVGRPALDFEADDTNPFSPTFGQRFSLASLEGKIVVLVFLASGCDPCCEQGEAAREVVDALRAAPDVFIAAVDVRSVLLGGTPESIAKCVNVDVDGTPPLVSDWPYLRDNAEWQIWNRYCADNYRTVIIDTQRKITYYREVNFEDAPFREELLWAVDLARGTPP